MSAMSSRLRREEVGEVLSSYSLASRATRSKVNAMRTILLTLSGR